MRLGLIPLAVTVAWAFAAVLGGTTNVVGDSVNSLRYDDLDLRGLTGAAFALPGVVAYGLGRAAAVVGSTRSERRELAVERAEVSATAVATAERARLARELHDVVAHHVSLVAVRAETGPYTLSDPTPDVQALLAEIAQGARLALDELRTILGVLRRPGDEPAERAPQPTLADIRALVGAAVNAGQRVELTWAADEEKVRDAAGLVAYRVVQEALTNARSHAAGSVAHVDVRTTDDSLHVRVANDAPVGAATSSQQRPGFGLVGLRERVVAAGGQLSAGPTPDGGFLVDARLPLGGSA